MPKHKQYYRDGRYGTKPCDFCGKPFPFTTRKPERQARQKYCSHACRQRGSYAKGLTGVSQMHHAVKRKLAEDPSLSMKWYSMRGEASCHWKKDRSTVVNRRRLTAAGVDWRKKVFTRDNYTCQICKKRGVELHPDHVVPYWQATEQFRWALCNGRTLCVDCHKETPTFANAGKKLKKEYEQLAEMMSELK